MSLVQKSELADVLGINDSDIPLSVYQWAITVFYSITDLQANETQKTHREFVNRPQSYLKLPDTNIKQIDELKIDNEPQDFTLFSDLKFNPDTGLVNYLSGFSGLVEITYTINAATIGNIHNYLISLLVTKGLSTFTPSKLGQIKMVKIGKYQKQFSNVANDLEDYIKTLNEEIMKTVGIIAGDDGRMKFGSII